MSETVAYIDRYFSGELNPQEQKAFEDRCHADATFAKAVAMYISFHDQLTSQWAKDKQRDFDELERELDLPAAHRSIVGTGPTGSTSIEDKETDVPPSIQMVGNAVHYEDGAHPTEERAPTIGIDQRIERPIKSTTWKRLAVAAAVLLVVGIGVVQYVQTRKADQAIALDQQKSRPGSPSVIDSTASRQGSARDSSIDNLAKTHGDEKQPGDIAEPGQLFARNFVPEKAPNALPGLLEEAMQLYSSGSYVNAIGAFAEAVEVVKNLSTRAPEDQSDIAERKLVLFYADYYRGLSYLAAGNAEKAIQTFKNIKEIPDDHWRGKLQWYLALAYIKNEQSTYAPSLLEKVVANGPAAEYRKRAGDLLAQLKKIDPQK